jgi:ABC-type dipeptide/oligopeptide/nickel transport system ATPase subunit
MRWRKRCDWWGLTIEMCVASIRISFPAVSCKAFPLRAPHPASRIILVADEPVSMIDASLRMNVINLFLSLKEEFSRSFLYITHDLATAYYISDYIAVMYRGCIVEFGDARTILPIPTPLHAIAARLDS